MRLRSKPEFSGRFFSWKATISIDRNKGIQEYFLVFSSGKREAVKRHLWLKHLWAELSREEFLLFLLTLDDSEDKKWAFLKAQNLIPKKTLRRRVVSIEKLLGVRESTRDSYFGSQRLRIEIQRGIRKLPRTPKYSGYVRSIAALGKSSRTLELSLEELIGDDFTNETRFDWYNALTVKEVHPLLKAMMNLSEET